jgi:hypothetical protein
MVPKSKNQNMGPIIYVFKRYVNKKYLARKLHKNPQKIRMLENLKVPKIEMRRKRPIPILIPNQKGGCTWVDVVVSSISYDDSFISIHLDMFMTSKNRAKIINILYLIGQYYTVVLA